MTLGRGQLPCPRRKAKYRRCATDERRFGGRPVRENFFRSGLPASPRRKAKYRRCATDERRFGGRPVRENFFRSGLRLSVGASPTPWGVPYSFEKKNKPPGEYGTWILNRASRYRAEY